MGEVVPFELRGLTAEQVGELLGYSARYVAEDLACKPDFPKATYAGDKPRWIAGEVMKYRELTRVSRRARRRKTGNKSAAT